MSSNGTERAPASAAGPMRCARCDCTFKRSEHLKRHERIHDTHKRFACSQCQKLFTRSDILRRHEATHAVVEQANGQRSSRTRACTECARSRERCTKSDPCQRCHARGLRCVYPQPRQGARQPQSPLEQGPLYQTHASSFGQAIPHDDDGLRRESMAMSGQPLAPNTDDHSPTAQNGFTPYNGVEKQILPFEMVNPMVPGFQDNQFLQSTMDFPMNWLPPDNSLQIDYDSIVGLGVSSLDFFSLPSAPENDNDLVTVPQNRQLENNAALVANIAPSPLTQHNLGPMTDRQHSPIWTTASPTIGDTYVSSQSPHSIGHASSPSATPGGLYATSSTGARMPCTVRARRASRFIPGGSMIPQVTDAGWDLPVIHDPLFFPDTSHFFLDSMIAQLDPGPMSMTETTYKRIRQEFSKLCLEESCTFPAYDNPHFPSLATLNMFIGLYFESFDEIVPILHHHTTRINDSWLLALAVCAIGCHFAEADEYSRSVEPMHEFLRRGIRIEFENKPLQGLGSKREDVALSQAITLSHIGMLYCGSPRLLRHAKDHHSFVVEVAQSLSFSLLMPSTTPSQDQLQSGSHNTAWYSLIDDETKRRIGYTIWMIDCMAAYHFSQQPLMPPDLVPVPLPDDKIWQMKSPQDLLTKTASPQGQSVTSGSALSGTNPHQETPSMPSAIVALFREKHIDPELCELSRIILLHGVYREVFYIKDCFDGPLGDWVPPVQQNRSGFVRPVTPSNMETSGQDLLGSRRNAALDCVDVLHWAANGTIALAAGAEHPTVLHLHLSRTIILSPLNQIRTFAESIVSFSRQPACKPLDLARRKQILSIERDILEWAQRDQCKARLAVLHSGCLFWHIRRYSCRAFYEPMSVFLATLTLWAFSSYASRTSNGAHNINGRIERDMTDETAMAQGAESAASGLVDDFESAPTFIHLDRPNDDEMVQFFVRQGTASRMRVNVTGVGDIYSSSGPARILKEGRKILTAVSTAWGRTKEYVETLEILEGVATGRVQLT